MPKRPKYPKGATPQTEIEMVADSPVVQCRAATLAVLQHASDCAPGTLPDPHIAPTPRPGEPKDDKYDLFLRSDLNLSAVRLKQLAPEFSGVARTYKPAASVTQAQCGNLETVGDAVTLVTKAAGL
jgi:hypothetical protein